MLGEVSELSAAIVAALTAEGYRVCQVRPGATLRQLQGGHFEADLSAPSSVQELHRLLAGWEGNTVGAVISLLALCQPFCRPNCEDGEAPLKICAWTLNVIKELEDDLRASAREEGGWFVNVTILGGRFGLEDREGTGTTPRAFPPGLAAAGTIGMCKALARECPELTIKNIDIDQGIEPTLLALLLLEELTSGDEEEEVGLSRQGRWRLVLKKDPLPRTGAPVPIAHESVILVTGGAYGITASVVKALAIEARPRLILVGRSALPEEEPRQTRGLDVPALRRHLIEEVRRQGARTTPAEMERSLSRILKDRQIRANLQACRAAGATVEYHSLDVRDAEPFGRLIDELYERFGRIDGVVHAAGILGDKRVQDKTLESFANVFRTKVTGALTLARKLRPEHLKFLVFFSSVSGRFGNVGQVDYSAANEFLNKLADSLDWRWPKRVIAINWGPWQGGMFSDQLQHQFVSKGVPIISLEEGVSAFISELCCANRPSPEVVICAGIKYFERQRERRKQYAD